MTQFEKRNDNIIETVEQKAKRFPESGSFSEDEQKAFNDISINLNKLGNETYTADDVHQAVSKRFDTMISQKTQNLNREEQAKLAQVKSEILSQISWRSPKEALQKYGEMRSTLYGIIAASDGKSGDKDKELGASQENDKMEQNKKQEAFDSLRRLLNDHIKRREEDQKKLSSRSFLITQTEEQERQIAAENLEASLMTLA